MPATATHTKYQCPAGPGKLSGRVRGALHTSPGPQCALCSGSFGIVCSLPCCTADPGEFSGTSEAHYILANLRGESAKPKDSTVCGSLFYGLLMGQPVILATSGGWCTRARTHARTHTHVRAHTHTHQSHTLKTYTLHVHMLAQALGPRRQPCARWRSLKPVAPASQRPCTLAPRAGRPPWGAY